MKFGQIGRDFLKLLMAHQKTKSVLMYTSLPNGVINVNILALRKACGELLPCLCCAAHPVLGKAMNSEHCF